MVAPTADSTEWAGLAAMAKLFKDGTKSGLATVPHLTLKTRDGDITRHILGQGNPDDPITIANAMEGLGATMGDQVDLTKGQEEAPHQVFRNLSRAVMEIDQATPGVGTHNAKRGVTEEDPSSDNTITFGRQLEEDSGRPGRLVDSRWKKCHQARATINLNRHDCKLSSKVGTQKWMGDPRLN